MTGDDLGLVVCPDCRGALTFTGTHHSAELAEGALRCAGCSHEWPVTGGLPRLVEEAQVRGLDRLMRVAYDWFGALHDPAVRFLLPILQWEGIDRNNYIKRLELGSLEQPRGRRLRLLEVGIGGGANIPLIEQAVPKDVDLDIWGVDLSEGMLLQCRRRLACDPPRHRVRLILADAHALPFRDHTFDRVFHTGAINAYNDPRRGLAEMARVACPGTPIVVLDEQLDPHRAHGLYPRLMFKAMTLLDPSPRSPRALLPARAMDVLDEQASRFYYCLRFRMPPARKRATPKRRRG